MSKEKNLVIYEDEEPFEPGKFIPAVDAKDHCWADHFSSGPTRPKHTITGPAIDRLHEFEKLGLEPEEIKGRLEAADELRQEVDFMITTDRYGHFGAIRRLQCENAVLKGRLHQKTEEYGEKIMAMSEDCDKLQEENERLATKVGNLEAMLRKSDELRIELERKLSSSVNTNRALGKQIEFYQDKLERIDCILTEDDE